MLPLEQSQDTAPLPEEPFLRAMGKSIDSLISIEENEAPLSLNPTISSNLPGVGVGAVATMVYGASEVTANAKVRARLRELADEGYSHLPICIAKTQYSFSTDPALKGAPSGHSMDIREVRLSVGAGFVVVICGDVMTMPGLPKAPASQNIDVVDGKIVGLF